MTRGLRVVLLPLVLGLVLTVVVSDSGDSDLQQVAARGRFACHGLTHDQVLGPRPTYTRKRLAQFSNHKRMCRAMWLPRPRKTFVPQGLSVTGRSAWVAGYLHKPGYGERACRLLRVNLATGARLSASRVVGRVGTRPSTYCRHGGGVVATGKVVWIVEKNRLWRVRPGSSPARTLQADRVWRVKSPLRGSTVVATSQRIGLVPYQKTGPAYIHWFDFKTLRRRGVLDLDTRSVGRRQLGAVARTRIPTRVQGATIGPGGGLYLSRSSLACGELVTPKGRRVAFVPGAEGISFKTNGTRLWVVSESGARPYARSRKPLTPAVASFEWPGLVRGKKSGCGF